MTDSDSQTASADESSDASEPPRSVLVVDDERSMREFLSVMLKKEGHPVDVATTGEEALELIDDGHRFKLIMTDLKMSGVSGLDVLEHVKSVDPACQVIIMTAYATTETAISAIKSGAYDYITKPFKVDEAKIAVDRALEKYSLVHENLYLKEALEHRQGFGEIVGRSPAIQRVFKLISRVAPTSTTILVEGESGTGKELVARAIHRESGYADGPFRPVNCGAIPEDLIESELFGHVEGAFTGANRDKDGLFVSAEGGTVFLDEIGELPASSQVKLLRVLQEGHVRPVGASEQRDINCRIIAATNRDLRQRVEDGEFREDLYYRLNVIPIELPPLRERSGDIQLLLEHFLKKYADEIGNPIDGISREAMELLQQYDYPGNVRELQNIVERVVTLETSSMVQPESLPPQVRDDTDDGLPISVEVTESGVDMEGMVAELERNLIQQALELTDGNKTDAAELLGISFRSLRYRLDKYDL